MATEKQSAENAAFGQTAGLGAYNNTAQPQSEAPIADLAIPNPPGVGAAHPDKLSGDALVNSLGLGAFNKK